MNYRRTSIRSPFVNRRTLGLNQRGVRLDPVTEQQLIQMPHTGDIAYDLVGDPAIAKQSEVKLLTREQMLAPVMTENLNEVGESKELINRTVKSRIVDL